MLVSMKTPYSIKCSTDSFGSIILLSIIFTIGHLKQFRKSLPTLFALILFPSFVTIFRLKLNPFKTACVKDTLRYMYDLENCQSFHART